MKSLQEQLENQKLIAKFDIVLKWLYDGNDLGLGHVKGSIAKDVVYLQNFLPFHSNHLANIISELYSRSMIRSLNGADVKLLNLNSPNDYIYLGAYKLSNSGIIFWENGGFTGELLKETRTERRLDLQTKMTWVLAIGVVTPFFNDLFEIVDKLVDEDKTVGSYILAIIFSAILAYVIIYPIKNKDL